MLLLLLLVVVVVVFVVDDDVVVVAQIIECGYTLEAVLTRTHNLCFEAKLKNGHPCKTIFTT